ncbi:hypothetical protein F7P10_15840 [Actinomadura sp. WMMB 499]|nr:hypothetical protein F7P10_15840 [Actinomadura sp. WMMB 499]
MTENVPDALIFACAPPLPPLWTQTAEAKAFAFRWKSARRGPNTTYTPKPLLRSGSKPEPVTVTDSPAGSSPDVFETRRDAACAGPATATSPRPAAVATIAPVMRRLTRPTP